jgi:streptogramin lyase
MTKITMTAIGALLLAVGAHAQSLIFHDEIAGDLRIVDASDGETILFSALTLDRRLATDGHRHVWIPDSQNGQLLRFDLQSGAFCPLEFNEAPVAVSAVGGEGALLLTASATGGSQDSTLWRVEGEEVTFLATLPPHARMLQADADGGAWVVLAPNPAPANLLHVDAQGQVDLFLPLGVFPQAMRLARDGSLWVYTAIPAELRRFAVGVGLLASVPIPSGVRDFGLSPQSEVVLLREAEGILEFRDAEGQAPLPIPVGGHPRAMAFDGAGRLWIADPQSQLISRYPDPLSANPDLIIPGGGASQIGLEQASDFLAGAGAASDLDGDGIPARVERRWRFNPCDGAEAPFRMELLAPLSPGQVSLVRVSAPSCPASMVWLGAARDAAPYAQGAYGSSLSDDDLFAWFQMDGAPILVPSIFAMLDGSGEKLIPLAIPSEPSLSGAAFVMAFLVLEENFQFEGAWASAPLAVTIS